MRLFRLLTLALVAATASLSAASFTAGNLVILRVGDGSAALASSGTAGFLDEYTPAGVLVQSVAIPTATVGSNRRLVFSGTATSEGTLSLSTDGQYLVFAGYDAATGTGSITGSTSATINRIIGRVGPTGAIDTTTALTDASSGSNPRSAASDNGTNLWLTGGGGGPRYATLGGSTSTQVSTTLTNLRSLKIFGGQLYTTTASGTAVRLGAIGSGLPTTAGQTIVSLPGLPTSTGSPDDFFFADLTPSVAGLDTLYLADDGGTIQKYSLVSGSWVSNGNITASGVHGLTGSVSGTTVTLYSNSASKFSKVIDTTGYNAAPSASAVSDLVTAGTNKAFRGIAFAPVSANASTNPSATGAASPNPVTAGNSTTLSATVTAGTNPASASYTVTCDLTAIGGSSTFSLPSPGFSAPYSVPGATNAQTYSLPCTVTDDQSRTGNFNLSLQVTSPAPTNPSGVGSSNPNSVQTGATSLLTVTVTAGNNPVSSGLAVIADLSAIGGSAAQQFFNDGTNGDAVANDSIFSFSATVTGTPGGKSLPVTITDAQSRTGSASIALTIQSPPVTTIKISQVYGGGGNSGATYSNDFIELFNQSTLPVDVSTWSVQKASAGVSTWEITNLCPNSGTCVIQPGHYYLVQEAAGTNLNTVALPAADITGIIAMGAGSGKIALVANTTLLTGGCPTGAGIVDFVGYGGTGTSVPSCYEGAPAGVASATTAAIRKTNGCLDTNNNSNDFVIAGPTPRNSSSPANTCGGDPTQISGIGSATPPSVDPAGSVLLAVTVTPATTPVSSGIAVAGDLTSIGGSATQQFYDDGTHGDVTSGDNVFSFRIGTPAAAAYGAKSVQTTITDAQARTAHAPITISIQSPTCGVERWAVKTGTDAGAGAVDLLHPVRTTIKSLRAIPAPTLNSNPPYDPRFAPTETTAYVINGILTSYKLEDDVDYHIVMQDPNGNTMVTEIPSPACDGSTSPFDAMVAAVRAKFDARFTATSSFQNAGVPVQMTGVGFFDFIHGQTGVAPNGIELHPILDITFTTASTNVISSSANPSTYASPVTLTATVTSAGGTATGDVSFFDGDTFLGTGTLNGSGQASFTTSALTAGSHSITATYDGDANVAQSASLAFNQNVNQAVPVITWANPADLIYGSALGATQLNATAPVPGTFVYTPPSGTVLSVGNAQTLSVVFTPTSSNYAAAAKNVSINILPASGGSTPAALVVTRTMARVSGQVVVTLTIANTGGTAAQNVTLTAAKIGTTSGTPLPQTLGTIAAGSSVQSVVNFPGTVGAAGSGSTLTISGTYTGGTFGSSARIVLP